MFAEKAHIKAHVNLLMDKSSTAVFIVKAGAKLQQSCNATVGLYVRSWVALQASRYPAHFWQQTGYALSSILSRKRARRQRNRYANYASPIH